MGRLTKKLWRPRKKVGRKYGGGVTDLISSYGKPVTSTTSTLCPVTKPVCIRVINGQQIHCSSPRDESSPAEELNHAYEVMNSEKPDSNVCPNGGDRNCFCLNVDSVWITNIKEAVRRLQVIINAPKTAAPLSSLTNADKQNILQTTSKNSFTIDSFVNNLLILLKKKYIKNTNPKILEFLRLLTDISEQITVVVGDKNEFLDFQQFIVTNILLSPSPQTVTQQPPTQQPPTQQPPSQLNGGAYPQEGLVANTNFGLKPLLPAAQTITSSNTDPSLKDVLKKIEFIFDLGKYVVLEEITNNVTVLDGILVELKAINIFFATALTPTSSTQSLQGGKTRKLYKNKRGGAPGMWLAILALGCTVGGIITAAAFTGGAGIVGLLPLIIGAFAVGGVGAIGLAVDYFHDRIQGNKDATSYKVKIKEYQYKFVMNSMWYFIFYLFGNLFKTSTPGCDKMYAYLTVGCEQRWDSIIEPALNKFLSNGSFIQNTLLPLDCNQRYVKEQINFFKLSFSKVHENFMSYARLISLL